MKVHIPKPPESVKNSITKIANTVTQFLAHQNILTISHPPYSLDLAPNDFFAYPTPKNDLKGRRFDTKQDAHKALVAILKKIAKGDFSHVYQVWQGWWDWFIFLNADYIVGDCSAAD